MRRMKVWPALAAVLLVALLAGARPAAAQETGGFTLTILHTNDVHARHEQYALALAACSPARAAAGECIGGAARRMTMINRWRTGENGANTVLVDAGDAFQGTVLCTEQKTAGAAQIMNSLGYQAMAVGNHEFDNGPGNLAHFAEQIDFPLLSANVDASASEALAGKIQPYTIVDINGQRVGLTGITTRDAAGRSLAGRDVHFGDYAASLQPVIAELQTQGVDKIVLLSHAGYPLDQQLAATIDGIDVIVGGHTHALLGSGPGAIGPYPTVVYSPNGSPVLIVTAGAYGEYLGRISVTFDGAGTPVAWEGEPIPLGGAIEQDGAMLAQVEEMTAATSGTRQCLRDLLPSVPTALHDLLKGANGTE